MSSIAVAAALSVLIGLLTWLVGTMRTRGIRTHSRGLIRAALAVCFVAATAILVILKAQLVPMDVATIAVIFVGLVIFIIQSFRGFSALALVPPNKSLERSREP